MNLPKLGQVGTDNISVDKAWEILRKRVWGQVDIRGEDDCWNWTGTRSNGYGIVMFNRRRYQAHRMTYFLEFGAIEENILVRHACGNRLCCNPKHMMLGTDFDNAIDAILHVTLNVGKKDFSRKLNEEDARVIKYCLKYYNCEGMNGSLASYYDVSRTTIKKIENGKIWKHVKV